MKKMTISMLGLALFSFLLLQGCMGIVGRGPVVSAEKDITGFDSIDVSHAFTVSVTQSDHYRVVVKLNQNLMKYLVVRKEGSTLQVTMDKCRMYRHMDGEVIIEMPALRGVELSGACDGTLNGDWKTDKMTVSLSGASELTGMIRAEEMDLTLSGASELKLDGDARRVRAEGSGASDFKLEKFTTDNLSAELSGACDLICRVDGQLDADLSGASSVQYLGRPAMGRIETSGGSSVAKKD